MRNTAGVNQVLHRAALVSSLAIAVLAGCPAEQRTDAPTPTEPRQSEVFTRSNWEVLATDPDAHRGARVDVAGKVFVAPERGDEAVVWQMFVDPEAGDLTCVVRYDDPSFDVSSGDYLQITGTVEKELRGRNALGGEVRAPVVHADTVTRTDAMATMPKPECAMDVGAAKSQHGVTITIERVEVAPRETRVFVKVANGGSAKFHFHSFSASIVQGDSQFDPEFRMEYPEPQTELLPGVSTSGVVPFERIDPKQGFRVILEGMSDNWQTEFKPFEFSIPSLADRSAPSVNSNAGGKDP